MNALHVAFVALVALAVLVGGALVALAEAADACPGSHLKPSCDLDERPVCRCDSSALRCEWACEPRP